MSKKTKERILNLKLHRLLEKIQTFNRYKIENKINLLEILKYLEVALSKCNLIQGS